MPDTVDDKINQTIVNQEVGKCPIESTNMLSRGKSKAKLFLLTYEIVTVYDMKNLKVPD